MGIGIWQILLILIVVLIMFGAGRLPKVMGDLGKGIKSFKAGLNGETDKKEDAPFIVNTNADKDKDV